MLPWTLIVPVCWGGGGVEIVTLNYCVNYCVNIEILLGYYKS